jgi:predicted Zn-dependent peptidase
MKSSLLMGLERPGARAEQIAGQMFAFGRILSVAEMVEKLDAVGVDEVRRFASQIMQSPAPAIAALGPIGRLESYDCFARRFGAPSALRAAE